MYLYATSKSHEILCLDTPEQVRSYDLKFKPKGGVLADEMGLGKTVEVIGLIAANPRTDFTPDPTEKKRHQTKATLIICPNHLVAQWKSEIEKYCGKKMTVVVITTIVQVKKYTSQDIIDAGNVENSFHHVRVIILTYYLDVVLITYNLLGNNNYAKFKAEHMVCREHYINSCVVILKLLPIRLCDHSQAKELFYIIFTGTEWSVMKATNTVNCQVCITFITSISHNAKYFV
jgi:hypothetical protein